MSRLVFQPHARQALKRGIDAMAAAVLPTLGPGARHVALQHSIRSRSPELLDDGGTIARRLLQLPDRDADVGAMLLRETLWRQTEAYGDGAATAAALYQTVFEEGCRFITAAGNAMLLRKHLERGMKMMLEDLAEQVRMIDEPSEIERLAASISGDADIAKRLADIFEVLGPHQPIEVREGGRELQHDFFLGSYWDAKIPSTTVFEGRRGTRLNLEHTAWVISDFELDDLTALVKLVTDVYQAGFSSLVIMAKSFSEQIIAAQGANSRMRDFTLVYLEPSGLLDEQEAALEDVALITGGQVLRQAAGHRLDRIPAEAWGQSELAWLDSDRFGIIAGQGDAAAIQREIAALERRFAESGDERQAMVTRTRIGRLRGGSAVVWCGGSAESEIRHQQERITRTIAAIRSALLEGCLPGGGMALLACRPRLQARYESSGDIHERAACQILMRASAAPCKQLLVNAGHDAPGLIIHELQARRNGTGYDVQAGQFVEMAQGGAVDSAAAVMAAVRHGIGGAALALTVDVILHRPNPPLALNPSDRPSANQLVNDSERSMT